MPRPFDEDLPQQDEVDFNAGSARRLDRCRPAGDRRAPTGDSLLTAMAEGPKA